jgi:hypothetical protein
MSNRQMRMQSPAPPLYAYAQTQKLTRTPHDALTRIRTPCPVVNVNINKVAEAGVEVSSSTSASKHRFAARVLANRSSS